MKLERYEEYKDSKVGWLGQVPSSWEVRRNKNVFYEASQLSEDGSETLLTVSHITGVTPRSEKNVNMFMAETMQGYKVCKLGDLVINTMWAWMGALGVVRHHGICSPAYGVYRPIKGVPYVPRYFDYLFRTPNFITEMTRSSKGIVSSRLRLYPKDFYQLQTVVPSLQEQQAIVEYLDKRVLVFDKTAALLERKISKFLELRNALVLEAVCRGIAPNAPRKPSGVAWLGDIPSHWEVRRLKDVCSIVNGATPKSGVAQFWDGDVTWITPADFGKERFVVESSKKLTNEGLKSCGTTLVPPGSLVISSRAPIGSVAIVGVELCTNQGCKALVPSRRIHNIFLYNFLLTQSETLNALGNGTLFKELSTGVLSGFKIPFPPHAEQVEIAAFLEQKTQKIDSIVTNLKAQIEMLKELRKTLINEVVTGKLKVTE
ncbi:hypothetical protein FY528_05160 [Hymenobacter lutimineralis]|uniref:Type I restriction modification DNA specificity domain-containing protein n=1 Tax=Hymenobacter lutimineralis TaxID=2606448 RepID=A0A5D6V9N3_9BACT|nr:restriction endonuclease subunit S [Hymenobacter lutimineralis]TYZ12681.1 hypothetical protein FY528_05160 [Hymenobacter lutimineralis]